MTANPFGEGTIAGYRVVRRLGSGSRADVFLGAGTTGTVALKVFSAETSRESVGFEMDALGRLESPHLVRLVDISAASDALPILIMERVGPASVTAVIARRNAIECGEAITLLAPIAALVGELHSAGVAHGNITASSVHLGASGEPVLLGLGHCELFAAGSSMAAIDAQPAAARDRDALAAMTLGILSRVRDAREHPGVRDLAHWLENAQKACEFPAELADRLFSCAAPLPVAISMEVGSSEIPGRASPPTLPVPPEAEGARSNHAVSRLPILTASLLLDNPIGELKKRARELVRGVRARFWVAAGIIVAGLILAITLIPSSSAPRAAEVQSRPAQVTEAPVATQSPLPADPVLASKLLLEARANCIHELSILCLDGVDEASSSAFTSDSALIQQARSGGALPQDSVARSTDLTLVERLGDTALIGPGADQRAPTILAIRTRAGWRIRDYLTGAQATSAAPSR